MNDKDGISAALMLAQCAAELKRDGHTMSGYLANIWETYGYHGTEQISIRVNDISQVDSVLSRLRAHQPQELAGVALSKYEDLALPTGNLPPTNGITMWFGDSIRVIVRPSGTEAKLKCYIEVASSGSNKSDIALVNQQIKLLRSELLELLKV